jgi:hypothetical protein
MLIIGVILVPSGSLGLKMHVSSRSATTSPRICESSADGNNEVKVILPKVNCLPYLGVVMAPLPAYATAQEALQLLDGYQTRIPDEVTTTVMVILLYWIWWTANRLSSFLWHALSKNIAVICLSHRRSECFLALTGLASLAARRETAVGLYVSWPLNRLTQSRVLSIKPSDAGKKRQFHSSPVEWRRSRGT